MTLLHLALTVLAAILLVPCGVLLLQVLAALLPANHLDAMQAVPAPQKAAPLNVCLLMPAHNEAGGITQVLLALLPQLGPNTRLLLVADNCTDATAAIAREVGGVSGWIEVIERQNDHLRGKGYALDHGVRHLERNPPDVVLIVDADCLVAPGAVALLACVCTATQRPVQALYLMRSPAECGHKTRLAEFAWLVKNQVRPMGYHRLGLPCALMGTGMAFTWAHLSKAQLATGHIVEDMQLGIDLARVGAPPLFCPQTLVTSYFPTTTEGLVAQRTRWEHGHMGVILAEVPALLWRAVVRQNAQLFAMALDLCVPPLALLTLLVTATLTVSGLVLGLGGGVYATAVASMAFVMLILAVGLAWLRFGRDAIGFGQLCSVPWYVLKKVPLYLFFLIKRQRQWVRSQREDEQ